MADDDEEELEGGLYEDGHWIWSDSAGSLMFISDLPEISQVQIQTNIVLTGAIDFRSDVDLIEQIRYRRRYQRKIQPGDASVITLQDVKDLVIYTAPISIMSATMINILHLTSTERFLRALILYCAYFVQISDEMGLRMLDLETKLRTPYCDRQEAEYRDNLADLRLLIAKEYSILLIGGGDLRPFHHMGPSKKRKSLSDKDARFFETFLRICIQIVWLAIGRKAFRQIEVEVHRLFKTETFNVSEHRNKTEYLSKMSPEEKAVMFGHCKKFSGKLHLQSPLMNDIVCHRPIDYRLLGLGVVKCPKITSRLIYFLLAVHAPEEELSDKGVVLGLIGLPRNTFDTMLNPLPVYVESSKSKGSVFSQKSFGSKKSFGSTRSSRSGTVKMSKIINQKLYPDIVLPIRSDKGVYYPPSFPEEEEYSTTISETQKRRWLDRLKKLTQGHHHT